MAVCRSAFRLTCRAEARPTGLDCFAALAKTAWGAETGRLIWLCAFNDAHLHAKQVKNIV